MLAAPVLDTCLLHCNIQRVAHCACVVLFRVLWQMMLCLPACAALCLRLAALFCNIDACFDPRALLQGHAMYYGPAQHAVDWFDFLGYTLPYGINAADFILDLASSDISRGKR